MSKPNRTGRRRGAASRARGSQAHSALGTSLDHADARPDTTPAAGPEGDTTPEVPVTSSTTASDRPMVGPITPAQRAKTDGRLGAWESTMLPPVDDAERRALRADLGEALGIIAPAVHPQTTDTAVLPVVTGDTAPLTPPIPRGGPVGPAIPGTYRVEPIAARPERAAATGFLGLPPIPAPAPAPPASVPITAELQHRIFGAPWPRVVELCDAEFSRFDFVRVGAIHHVPTDEAAVAAAALHCFRRTPLEWNGQEYVGGEPRASRMDPTVVMYALAFHVRDYRAAKATAVTGGAR